MIKRSIGWVMDNMAELVVATILFVILLILVYGAILEANNSALRYSGKQAAVACLAQGYPDYRIAYEETEQFVYCVRLENGTERVIRLEDIGQ